LFPYGFASSRDSIAESFAGDSADQFLHWFAAQTRTNWGAWAGDTSWLPSGSKPSVPGSAPFKETDDWSSPQTITPNLQYERHDTEDGVMRVVFKRGPITDFSGIYRMWSESVTVPDPRPTSGGTPVSLSTDSALAINLEASWPSDLPYPRRQKHVYRLEVFRPDPL
jgi:hypothetical protein